MFEDDTNMKLSNILRDKYGSKISDIHEKTELFRKGTYNQPNSSIS